MANEEMIQKHLDNFLAKIAGETPVDDTIQDSTEFWLNEIAEQGGGGGTEVIANPTLAGTEAALTGLEVDGTKYKVPSNYLPLAGGTMTGVITGADGAIIKGNDGNQIVAATSAYSTFGADSRRMSLRTDNHDIDHNRNGNNYIVLDTFNTQGNPPAMAGAVNLTGLKVNSITYKVRDGVTNGLGYLTTAPTAANTDGIKIVVLSSEPAAKYNGYLYIILA